MAAEKIEVLVAETRTEFGKGFARRLRAAGRVPAVVYGAGSEALHISLPGHDTAMVLRHAEKLAVVKVEIDGKVSEVIVKEIQVDPIKRVIEHVDFVAQA